MVTHSSRVAATRWECRFSGREASGEKVGIFGFSGSDGRVSFAGRDSCEQPVAEGAGFEKSAKPRQESDVKSGLVVGAQQQEYQPHRDAVGGGEVGCLF